MNKQKANTRLERGPIDVSEYLPGTKVVFIPGDLFTIVRTGNEGTRSYLDCAVVISHQTSVISNHTVLFLATGIQVSSRFVENGKTMSLMARIKTGATDELIILDKRSTFLGNITEDTLDDIIPFTVSVQIPEYTKEITTQAFINKIKTIRLLEESR